MCAYWCVVTHLCAVCHTVAKMESRDQPPPADSKDIPESANEGVAEKKGSARADVNGVGEVNLGKGEPAKESSKGKKEMAEEERSKLAEEKHQRAKGPVAVTTSSQGPGRSDEYILEGFDFSTGTLVLHV